ncbi:FUSC family protein [Chromobacterium sp. IIBBL 290-4]|uniref:FUSC family protein n=1 Tax=Chromobacterium sp. IIBBL 290-4 TaxID=2953890 RepID=UPI0020B80DCE|nr:FUSC family protein [Chromobacterium sp. IIBBL 290-4]UTH76229.1 FUSC family protein [Chromobacterium sp. IIBBL 290-4]
MSGSLAAAGRRVAADWLATEGESWSFAAKTMLSAFAALWIAFRLGFDSPSTAMISVFLVAFPRSGAVLEKSVYRILGTLVGSVMALGLAGVFDGQPVLMLISMALWVGVCASGATQYRDSRSYAFVLSGYTACIIGLPALNHPLAIFNLAVTRVSEISLGILCCALVNDFILPKSQTELVVRTVRSRYHGFALLCRQALAQRLDKSTLEATQLRFAADIAALEAGRAAAFFEAGNLRARSNQLHAFNATFMAALTTFHTLHRQMERLRADAASPLLGLLYPLFALAAEALEREDGPARTALEAGETLEKLEAMRPALAQGLEEARERLLAMPHDETQRIEFDTASELLQRFVDEMVSFTAVYHGLKQRHPRQVEALAYSPRTPAAIVLASGARAALTLLTLSLAWYWLAWPSALGAVLLATIFCGLASSSPRPTLMVKQILIGFAVGTPLAYVCAFWMVNQAEGFAQLALAMAPFLALGCYLKSLPKTAGIGTGIILMIAQGVEPQNLMRFDVTGFFNDSIARLLGLGLAALFFVLVLPEHTMGSRRHIAAALWREARSTCRAALPHLRQRFGNRIRDLLNQLSAAPGPRDDPARQATVSQAITLLEMGLAIVDLRELADGAPSAVRQALLEAVAALDRYFAAPDEAALRQALAALRAGGPPIRERQAAAWPDEFARLKRMLATLHLIHTSLLDALPDTGENHAA